MDSWNQRIRRWGPAVVLMALIFGFSSIPKGTLIPDFDVWDYVIKKSAHIVIYAVLANSYLWALTGWRAVRRRHFILALLLAAAYGATDEIHQRFVPGREGTALDVGIDTFGGSLGLLVWRLRSGQAPAETRRRTRGRLRTGRRREQRKSPEDQTIH